MEASSSSTSATMVSSDPVSSLRAAALSTLKKSKRRKAAAVEKPIPVSLRPPPPSDSFQLDYGQEDNNVKTDPGRLASEVSQVKEKSPTPIIDTQMREEGEISDEEGPSNIPMQIDDYGFHKSSKSPIPLKSVTPETYMNTTLHIRPTPPPLSPSPRSLSPETQPTRAQLQSQLVRTRQHPPPALIDRLSLKPETFVPVFKKEEEVVKIPMLGVSEPDDTVDIGPDRVRPGIDLNQEDYDTVKGIILDLLGWGVPFEFLVDCGVSKEVIFYVFNELELRLPDDFDSSGLIPYTPETIAQIQQQPASMPPPPPPPEKETDLLEPRASPITEAPQTVSTPPAGPLESLSPVLESPQNTDLHDMEKQRRQVLLARKAAVQASRKQKQHVPAKTSVEISAEANDPMVTDSDINDVAPYAVTETVEDFLNSLSAVKAPEPEPSAVLSVNPEAESTSMNVEPQEQSITDQAIGLERDQVANGLNSAISEHFSISSSFADPPPTSVGSSTSNFSYFSSSTPPTPVDVFPRRGSKRPVAADFVDFDPAPKRQEHMSHIERINGTGSITRRLTKGTTFQNINSRRCVIELSDSESEEDEEAEDPLRRLQPQESSMQWRDKRIQPPPRKYPSPAPIKSVTSGTMSPSLEEKELEIRRLREWIAQREEETRLRKLALARSASATNLNNGGVSTSVAQATPLKLEEVDIVISAESAPHVPGKEIQNIEPATPLPAVESPVEDNGMDVDDDVAERQDANPEAQESRAARYPFLIRPDSFLINVPDVLSHLSTDHAITQRQLQHAERSVDADQSSSPSTQMGSPTPPPALPKQDASTLEEFQSTSHDLPPQEEEVFSSYKSPFEFYPRLRNVADAMSSASQPLSPDFVSDLYPTSLSSLSLHSESVDAKSADAAYHPYVYRPDLKPLKLATLGKNLDPSKRLCRYEVPGGGTCRDNGCEDIHLSRLEGANQLGTVEPNDEDTAEYLFNVMPRSWLRQNNVASSSTILSAIRNVRQDIGADSLEYEDRVAKALQYLGPPPKT